MLARNMVIFQAVKNYHDDRHEHPQKLQAYEELHH